MEGKGKIVFVTGTDTGVGKSVVTGVLARDMRKGGIDVVSCPTCGRTKIDLSGLAEQVETMVAGYDLPIKVAVMGCAVNGPGEAKEADLGIAGGNGEGLVFRKGVIVRKVPESELLSALREEIEAYEVV